ncbi:hypothetical protein D9757_006058 [Collybiopsis confluens]|uniref:Uncharacterized protein n=1 Tax=Collybiopsis confluens TaxID=2823264 RepID=A0A8H5HUI2_9AGAR|nr:hypothetical protein D9757_006058 [Collybiopsis confluens]
MYRLYAVVVHIGNMLGGHYISYTALPNASDLPAAATRDDSSNLPPLPVPPNRTRQFLPYPFGPSFWTPEGGYDRRATYCIGCVLESSSITGHVHMKTCHQQHSIYSSVILGMTWLVHLRRKMPSSDSNTGFDYIQWNYHDICGIIGESALYGIYLTLIVYALRHLWFLDSSRTNRTKGRVVTVLSLLLMFSISTTLWTLDIVNIIRGLNQVLLNTTGSMDQRVQDYENELNTRIIVQTTLFSVEYLIGDSVVAWRACALWGYNKKIMFLPVLLLTSATVLVSFFVGCLGVTHWGFLEGESKICYNSYTGVVFLSIATNVVATALIAAKAWTHHRFLLRASVERKTRILKVLVLMVESGLIYLLVWATKTVGAFGAPHSAGAQFAVTILNMLGNQIVGLYPTLLVILVRMQHTSFDTGDPKKYNKLAKV